MVKIPKINKMFRPRRASSKGLTASKITFVGSNASFMYHVYIIECKDKTLYTGITTDMERRFKEHKSGKGGAYTRAKKVVKVLYTEQFKTRSEASKREAEIKGWPRDKKLVLVLSKTGAIYKFIK